MWPLRSHREVGKRAAHSSGGPDALAILADSQDRDTAAQLEKSDSWNLRVVSELEQGLAYSADRPLAVVVLDRDLPGNDWPAAVHKLALSRSAPCVILASTVMDDLLFEEVIKNGGFDVVAKPIRRDELLGMARLAVGFWKSRMAGRTNE